jgi:hypothetical protein
MLRFFFQFLFFSFIFLFRQALGSRRIGQYSIIARIFTGRIVNVRGIGTNVLWRFAPGIVRPVLINSVSEPLSSRLSAKPRGASDLDLDADLKVSSETSGGINNHGCGYLLTIMIFRDILSGPDPLIMYGWISRRVRSTLNSWVGVLRWRNDKMAISEFDRRVWTEHIEISGRLSGPLVMWGTALYCWIRLTGACE